jgi:glycosyltransferase involved in cell wall biosynthesis
VTPDVSVIMPVRDGGGYLPEAVDSILAQDHRNMELILVNDHSKDGAIDRLRRDDPRLSVMNSRGRGVSAAFNSGIAVARGRYIARMDADDIALPQRISRQLAYLDRHPRVDICGACVEIFSQEEVRGGNRRYQEWLNRCRSPADIHRELFIECPVPNPTALFRRDALARLDGYGDPDWPEDYDLFLRADGLGMKMGKPGGILLRWREHGQRVTRRQERYAIERFQRAKAYYLCRDRLPADTPLAIWGAGPSGRLLHDLLAEQGTTISGFIEVHPRRIGGKKRGLPVWSIREHRRICSTFVLVAVGAAGARREIRAYMRDLDRKEGKDFLFLA